MMKKEQWEVNIMLSLPQTKAPQQIDRHPVDSLLEPSIALR
jgi:hypothetical protein